MIRLARAEDNAQIAAIWNLEAMGTIATTDTEPRTPATQAAWLDAHTDARARPPFNGGPHHVENDPSLRLHERHGFARVGVERDAAFKLHRWLDVVTLQLMP